MKREFQVVYRVPGETLATAGPVQTVNVIAEKAEDAGATFQDAGYDVLKVSPVRAVIDWGKPSYPRIEAAYFLSKESDDYITRLQAAGKLPRGLTVFPRAVLEQFLLEGKAA